MKKAILMLSIFVLAFTPVFAEDNETTNPEPNPNPITFNCTTEKVEINVKESINMPCSVENAPQGITINYGSVNAAIASIDLNGKITAVSKGEVEVYMSFDYEGESYKKSIAVKVIDNTYSFEFNQKEVYLEKNRQVQLNYKASSNISKNDIIWDSSDSAVASVKDGVVTGHKKGRATIYAKVGEIEASTDVIVEVTLEELYFNSDGLNIALNKTEVIPELIYVPYDATISSSATYSIENEDIAIIEDETIKGLKVGETTLYAKIGGVETSIKINVEYEQTETQALLIEFQLDTRKGSALYYKLNKLTETENKFALVLNSSDVLEVLNEEKVVNIYLNIGDLTLEKIESVTVIESITKHFGDHTVNFIFINSLEEILFTYQFTNSAQTSLDLLYKLTFISTGEVYGNRVDGSAYSLSFKQDLPKKTMFQLGKGYIKATANQMVFVYPVIDNVLDTQGKEIKVNEQGMLMLEPTKVSVLTFNPISKSSSDTIIIFMLGVIALGVGSFVVYYYQKNKKETTKKENKTKEKAK